MSPPAKQDNPRQLEAARLARGGYHVGITLPQVKRPHPELMAKEVNSKGGVWKASNNEETVIRYLQACPKGNIFVSPRGRQVALDIDDVAAFKALLGDDFFNYLTSNFPTTQTPSGGFHIWFQLPPTFSTQLLPRKLQFGEFIYEGFYALVAPSIAKGKDGNPGEYLSINPLPDRSDDLPCLSNPDVEKIIFCFQGESREINEGERHDALVSHGVEMARNGFDFEEIEKRLWAINDTFNPPYAGQEAETEIGNVLRWVEEKIINSNNPPDGVTKIQFISMAALADRPAPRWFIPNLIPDGGLGFLIGKPGSGKSFFLQELTQCACRNTPLFGDQSLVPNKKGWVLCLLPEAVPSWAVRTRTYCDFHGVDYADNFLCCVEPLDLGNPNNWREVMKAAQEEIDRRSEPPALVIVDTLSAAIPGRDENSQSDMTPLMANLQEFVKMGASVIVSHHPTKYGNTYRGSSVIRGSCDWMISIRQTPGGVREFKAEKLRDSEEIARKAFVIESHGESAVCAASEGVGPWSYLNSLEFEHGGLREALLIHGFDIPDEPQLKAKDGDITGEGVSLSQIKKTWLKIDPIFPPHKVDQSLYKAADRERTTVLLGLMRVMIDSGIIEVLNGTVSKSDRKLSATVKQVFTREDV